MEVYTPEGEVAALTAAAKELRQISTPSNSAGEQKPFPFLRLPAEIRNRIYEYATADIPLRLRHSLPFHDRDRKQGYIGLNTVCRQVRAEFHPLFYRDCVVLIKLCDFRSFLRTFLSAAAINDTPITNLYVKVDHYHLSQREDWDILPLLQAKALKRHQQWWFWALHDDPWSPYRQKSWLKLNELRDAFNNIVNSSPRSFLGDIKSGMFSEIRFCRADGKASHEWNWKLVVRKKEGKLNEQEKKRMEEYCKQLAVRCRTDIEDFFGVQIFVTNTRGKLVEKYVWNAKMSRMEMLDGRRAT